MDGFQGHPRGYGRSPLARVCFPDDRGHSSLRVEHFFARLGFITGLFQQRNVVGFDRLLILELPNL